MPPYLEILRSVSDNSIQSSFHGAIPHELLYDVVCWCDCDKLPSLSTWQAQGGHPAAEDAVSIAHPKSKPQVLTCGSAPDRNLQMCLIDSQRNSTSVGDGMQSGSQDYLIKRI